MSWLADGTSAHRALLYQDEPGFRAVVGAFIREGLARGRHQCPPGAALPG